MTSTDEDNPFLKRQARRKIGDAGRKSEARTAKRTGARLKPASGAMKGAKGDMEKGDLLIESKSTIHDSMSVQLDWLAKVSQEARSEGKYPALTVTFTDQEGRPRKYGKWVMVPEHLIENLGGSE